MGKITMSLAMSLDGFIAEKDGSYEWIKGNISELRKINVGEPYVDYDVSIKGYQVIVMGAVTFAGGMHKQFANHAVLVVTRSPDQFPAESGVSFLKPEDAITKVRALKNQGQKIMIYGGGMTASLFIAEDLVDEFEIGIIPILLGDGIPLFHKMDKKLPLRLKTVFQESEIVVLRYVRER